MSSDHPERIGRYRVGGVLGRGGMGVVYDAESEDGRRVAIKTVLGFKNKFVDAVRREIHALARLSHPGLVGIVDEGIEADAPWYAMEFVDGVTLRAHARSLSTLPSGEAPASFLDALVTSVGSEMPTLTHAGGRLRPWVAPETTPGARESIGVETGVTGLSAGSTRPKGPPLRPEALAEMLGIMRRLALSLEYMHGRGLVHRDLKPDNVIVRVGGRPVIVDFGLVFYTDGGGARESIDELALLGAGTASYMAPEQIRGDGVDARTDLYSLGCILYEIVAGRSPFEGPTTLSVLNQQLHNDPMSLLLHAPWIPPALDALVGSLLEKNPRARPANAAVVARRVLEVARQAHFDIGARDDDDGGYARPTTPFLYRPALAGRGGVLDALDERLELLDKRGERGGVILLCGPSGIGKTRIAVEAARRAAGSGALVLAGEATARGARPLAPLRKVLQLVSEKCTRGGAEKTATLLGKTAKIFAAYEPSLVLVPGFELFPDPEPLPAPEARRRLLESLRGTLDSLALEQPLLVIIDDLQWADELTLAFLDHLASSEHDAPFLVVATVRSDEGEEVIDALAERPKTSVVRLDRLDRDAVAAIVDDALGTREAPPTPGPAPKIGGGERRNGPSTGGGDDARGTHEAPPTPGPAPKIGGGERRSGPSTDGGDDARGTHDERGADDDAWVTRMRDDGDGSGALLGTRVRSVDDGARARASAAGLASQRDVHDGLVDVVEARAHGVPFWITEVLQAGILERALLRDDDGVWHTDLALARSLPTSATDLLGLRLRDLPPVERAWVDATAVVGRGATAAVLRAVSGLDDRAALEAAASLRARQILDDDPDEGVRFAHDKLAEAAYALIDPATRANLHGRAAAVLEGERDRSGGLASGASNEALAWHHEQAGALAVAVEAWLAAGDAARALSALKDAERCYDRAVALYEKLGDVAGLAKTLMKLGLVHAAVFDTVGSQRSYARAFSLWSELRARSSSTTHAAALAGAAPTAKVRLTHQPRSLDPARAYDSDSLFVQAQLFEGLVELEADGDVLPAAASSWEVSGDGRTYTFQLRADGRWSDGAPVTASDFELSWKRTLDPRTKSPVAQLLYVLENARAYHEGALTDPRLVGVRAVGPRSLEVKLAAPSAYLLHLLSHPATFPIPARVFFEHGVRWTAPGNMTSNGAFALDERTNLQIRLRRNPLFTGRGDGNIAEIEVNAIRNYQECLVRYGEGTLDILDMLAADAAILAEARAKFGADLHMFPLYSTQYLVLRADRPPFDDERVRKALALLIDREALADKLAGSSQVVARGGFIAPGIAGHSPSLSLRYDPERAAALLADAGYASPDRLPPITWLHTHGLGDTTLLDVVRSSWQAAGVRVDLSELAWDDYERAIASSPPHVVLAGWIADYPDADTFTRAVFHSVEGAEKIGWSDARFDELCEKAAVTAHAKAREELYALADHLIVAEKCVVVPLSYGQDPVLLRNTIKTFPGAGSYLRQMKLVVVDDGAS